MIRDAMFSFAKIEHSATVYNDKHIGLKMEPCGTPQGTGAEKSEKCYILLILMYSVFQT